MKKIYLLLLFISPLSASASIEITEVAWMGSTESASHEWIELYNSGAQVNLSNWVLTDGNNLSITLAGVAPANSYVVLERSSDASAAGEAFLIYSGAIVNTGATLTLTNAAGDVVDQVYGGEGWGAIGGDNGTKETPQKSSSGWVTAPATPGHAVVSHSNSASQSEDIAVVVQDDRTQNTASSVAVPVVKGGGEPTVLTLPGVTLELTVTGSEIVHVNQPVSFDVTPSGIGDTLIDSLEYEWNFGDGSTAIGKEVVHSFSYPGRYVVVVEGSFKRQRQIARFEIEVLPVEIELSETRYGDFALTNASQSEIDIGSYRLVGHETFSFPKHTILLPGQSVVIEKEKTGNSNAEVMVALYDQAGDAVAINIPTHVKDSAQYTSPVVVPVKKTYAASAGMRTVQTETQSNQKFGFVTSTDDEMESAKSVPGAAIAYAADSQQSTTDEGESVPMLWRDVIDRWPFYVLFAVLLLGILSIYLVPVRERVED